MLVLCFNHTASEKRHQIDPSHHANSTAIRRGESRIFGIVLSLRSDAHRGFPLSPKLLGAEVCRDSRFLTGDAPPTMPISVTFRPSRRLQVPRAGCSLLL